jgi:tetratricopeptide (TPR) repeat protein
MKLSLSKKRKVLGRPPNLDSLFTDRPTDFSINEVCHTTDYLSDEYTNTKLQVELPEGGSLALVENYSNRALSCKEMGCALADQGRMSEAITKWQEGVLFSPKDHLLHELLAQGFLSLDRNMLALRSATAAVELCPLWTEGLLTLARIQRELGELVSSSETYQRIIFMEPKNVCALQEMSDLQPLLISLAERHKELLMKVQSSTSLDETEANTCILNLSMRARVE